MKGISWIIFLSLLFSLTPGIAGAQDSTMVLPDGFGEIKLSAAFDSQEVPKNRLATYTAQLEWQGNLGYFQILEVGNPQVENFEIEETAVVHRTEIRNGMPLAVKKYTFSLKPQSLGMAYAGDIVVRYKNIATNEEGQLMTNRLGIKVVDAVADPGEYFLFMPKSWLLPVALILILALVIIPGILWWRKRQEESKAEQERLAAQVVLEEAFLKALKTNVDLNSSDTITQFAEISRVLRQYLAEKYGIQALETTTGNILSSIETLEIEQKYRENISEVLKTCDLAKFSGGGLSGAELARTYTLVETILENVPEPKDEN